MNWSLRDEIAKQRFLDLMADGNSQEVSVKSAVSDADALIQALHYQQETGKAKGCRVCFGSGGKKDNPCKACGGTGKVTQKAN